LRAIFEQEEAENRRLNAAARPVQSTSRSTPQKIQEDNQRYLKVHKPAFDELISQIKERQKDEPPPELKVEQPEEKANSSSNDEDDEITILPTPIKIIEEVTLPDSDEEGSSGAGVKPSPLESSDSDSDLLDGFIASHLASPSYSPAGLDSSSSLGFYPTMVPDVLASSSSATPSSSNSFIIPSPPVLNSSSSSKQGSPASSES